ncbi:putative major facilitator superfamily transporter [Colletotrichum sublineola]|uniref:Putative major facilitator superfamily transporter n=1 Tax=Colletotrichum sublineola TaxID=1173701 RepID=A0A066XHJ3_COLSU|nr:putative major facilitator superfamily transporter [Colletotrichum sublineola]
MPSLADMEKSPGHDDDGRLEFDGETPSLSPGTDEESGAGADDLVRPRATPGKLTAPPNGGLRAWLQVLASFCIYFNTWGLVASFGVFQAHYETDLLEEYSPFAISTIGSLQSFLMVFLGCFAGPIFDLGYARELLWAGSLLIVVGTVAQSFSSTLWQLLLSQGLCIGIGMGSLAVLGVAVLSPWFSTRLPVAFGVAAAGSGVGGLVMPIIFRSLQPEIGFAWTVRTMALVSLAIQGVSIVSMHTPKASRQRRAWIDRSAFSDVPYLLFVAACCLVFLGMYTPFVYIQGFALQRGAVSSQVDKYLLAIMNAGSIMGRIIPNLFAQRLGGMNLLIAAVFIMSVAALCLMAVQHTAGLVVTLVFYGFSSGSFFALQPATFTKLTEDRNYIGTRLGMAYSVMSIALLFGSPVGGALVRSAGFSSAWIWSGVCLALGSAMIAFSRGMASGWDWKKRT